MSITANAPLHLDKLRDLELREPSAPGRSRFLSSASGLIRSGGMLYVVADDELQLGCFAVDGLVPGKLLRLFAGDLPAEPDKRKRRKADLEILLRLPVLPGYPHGALLALGSGSRQQRRRGALLALDAQGHVHGVVMEVDAAPLYQQLERDFDELNLEGGFVDGERFCLLQRGNKGGSNNALLEFDYARIAAVLVGDLALPDLAPRRVTQFDFGKIQGVLLCFTDACALADGRWLFSTVAEDTDDAISDGAFVGAAIGMASHENDVAWIRPLMPASKVEGIDVESGPDGLKLLCVTDPDNANLPAGLFTARL